MKLFTVKLTDDERARLEEHRVALGLRSHSDVVRHWIARAYKPEAVSRQWTAPLAYADVPVQEAMAPGFVTPETWAKVQAEHSRIASEQRKLLEGLPTIQLGPVKPKPGERLKKK